jgi:hypothetical protein
MNLIKKELYVAAYGQDTRFRIAKYAVLLPFFAFIYWRFGGIVLLKTLGVLFVISIAVHLFYRWMTNGWQDSWGGYKPLFK